MLPRACWQSDSSTFRSVPNRTAARAAQPLMIDDRAQAPTDGGAPSHLSPPPPLPSPAWKDACLPSVLPRKTGPARLPGDRAGTPKLPGNNAGAPKLPGDKAGEPKLARPSHPKSEAQSARSSLPWPSTDLPRTFHGPSTDLPLPSSGVAVPAAPEAAGCADTCEMVVGCVARLLQNASVAAAGAAGAGGTECARRIADESRTPTDAARAWCGEALEPSTAFHGPSTDLPPPSIRCGEALRHALQLPLTHGCKLATPRRLAFEWLASARAPPSAAEGAVAGAVSLAHTKEARARLKRFGLEFMAGLPHTRALVVHGLAAWLSSGPSF